MEKIKKFRRMDKIYYLTPDELNKLFSFIPETDKRARALFTFIYRYGLRLSEAINLKESDFGDDGRLFVQRTKGSNSNHYKVSEEDKSILDDYLKSKKTKTEYIFSKKSVGKVVNSTFFRLYQKYAKLAGLPQDKCHPHCLRHSIAVAMLDAGMNIEDVCDWLGHRSIVNTMVYAKISSKKRDENADKVMKLKIGKN